MNAIIAKIQDEPVLVTALIQGILTLVVSFGAHLTPEQIGAILALTGAVLAFVARSKVTPTPPAA